MSGLLLPTLVALITFAVILVILVLYSLRIEEKKTKNSYTSAQMLKNTSQKTSNIIYGAIKQANKLLSEAELVGIKTIAEQKVHTSYVEQVYEKKMNELMQSAITKLQTTLDTLDRNYRQFVVESESIMTNHLERNQKALDDHFVEIFRTNETRAQTFYQAQQQAIASVLNQELSRIKTTLHEYQQGQMHLIDETVVDIFEDAFKQVVGKRLTLEDHLELVKTSLEQAKATGLLKKLTQ